MKGEKAGGTAVVNAPSGQTAEDERKHAVIAEIMARVSLSELRAMPMISVGRAGAFMSYALRRECRACMLALNDSAAIISERHIRFGPKWQAEGLTRELLSFARLVGANKLILGTTVNAKWLELLAFNEVYNELRSVGVTLVDIIEVKDGSFTSVFRLFSPDKGPVYTEFQGKKKRRR